MNKRIFTIQFSFHKHYNILAGSPSDALKLYIVYQQEKYDRYQNIYLSSLGLGDNVLIQTSENCWKYVAQTGETFYIHENEVIE